MSEHNPVIITLVPENDSPASTRETLVSIKSMLNSFTGVKCARDNGEIVVTLTRPVYVEHMADEDVGTILIHTIAIARMHGYSLILE